MPICPIMSRPIKVSEHTSYEARYVWKNSKFLCLGDDCALWVDGGDWEACALTAIAQELMIAREEREAQAEPRDEAADTDKLMSELMDEVKAGIEREEALARIRERKGEGA